MLTIRSPDFENLGEIPQLHTCEGKDVSPALEFAGAPQGAKSLALVVHDPDAPDPAAPRMDYVHWVLYNLPPDCTGLPRGVAETALPGRALQGLNDWKKTGYGGPCPPAGDHPHRYFFTVFAVSTDALPVKADTSAAVIGFQLNFNTLAKAAIVGLYKR